MTVRISPFHPELRAIAEEVAALTSERGTIPPLEARARFEVLRDWLADVRVALPDPLDEEGDVMRRYRAALARVAAEKGVAARG